MVEEPAVHENAGQTPAAQLPLATSIVVPCYNEAKRLDIDEFVAFAGRRPWLTLIFVDDGSTDGTADLIAAAVRRCPDHVGSLILDDNSGKGEAVRRGILRALEGGAQLVAFWDADLATPLVDIDTFRQCFESRPNLEIAIASRVKLLGRQIERSAARHYFGRAAATAVSGILGIPVYDTQCGAKMFRATPRVHRIFSAPFITRWIFDVEILARWLSDRRPGEDLDRFMIEIPIQKWTNVGGSKLRFSDFLLGPLDLCRVYLHYRRAPR